MKSVKENVWLSFKSLDILKARSLSICKYYLLGSTVNCVLFTSTFNKHCMLCNITFVLTLKLFLTSKTTKVPEIGQMHRVIFSMRFSVMHTSVLQLGSDEAFESKLDVRRVKNNCVQLSESGYCNYLFSGNLTHPQSGIHSLLGEFSCWKIISTWAAFIGKLK